MGEKDLLRRFRAGDPEAINVVQGWIRSVIFRRFTFLARHADDIMQESLLHVWKSTSDPGFQIKKSFPAFVRLIAARVCIKYLRKAHKIAEPFGDDDPFSIEDVAGDESDPGDNIDYWLAIQIYRECKAEATFVCRQIFQLRLVEELTFEQIAQRLGRATGGMKARFKMCKDKLIECIRRKCKRRGIDFEDFGPLFA